MSQSLRVWTKGAAVCAAAAGALGLATFNAGAQIPRMTVEIELAGRGSVEVTARPAARGTAVTCVAFLKLNGNDYTILFRETALSRVRMRATDLPNGTYRAVVTCADRTVGSRTETTDSVTIGP